jgi:hypothetical protein
MKKNIRFTIGSLAIALSVLGLSGCGKSVTINFDSANSEIESEKQTTTKSSAENSDEEETTKKSSKKTTEYDEEEETTKKSSKKTTDSYDDDDDTSTGSKSNWKTYSGTGYTIELGSDWTKTTNAAAELAFTHLGSSTDGFSENINVIVQDISAYDLDLESYLEMSLEQYEQLEYDVISYKHMTVNGVKGYYCVISTEVNSITCYISQYFTVIDDAAYVFTFAADEDGFDELEDEVKDIYKTIEFE